tara:strand:- start:425 stop:1024 length:600 start_codon:yes stop_codon:yes gene_type:complete
MRVDKEAFVKRWWSKYQENYALIESPVKRIEFLDRLLVQSKHVLFSDQIKSFIIEKREIARAERRQEEFVRKIHQSSILKSEEPLSETSKANNQKSNNLKKSSQDSIDEMGLLLREIIRNNPSFTAEKIWRELKRETERKNKNYESGSILQIFDPNQHKSSSHPQGVILWKSKKRKKLCQMGFRALSNRLVQIRKELTK